MERGSPYLWICPVLSAACLLVLAGCGGGSRATARPGYVDEYHHALACRPPARNPVLLFDRIPGQPDGTAFNTRSDWPCTSTHRRGGEIRYYATYVSDRQGTGWYHHDLFYRSARYYQFGHEER